MGSTDRGVSYSRFELGTTRSSTGFYLWTRQRVNIYGDKGNRGSGLGRKILQGQENKPRDEDRVDGSDTGTGSKGKLDWIGNR